MKVQKKEQMGKKQDNNVLLSKNMVEIQNHFQISRQQNRARAGDDRGKRQGEQKRDGFNRQYLKQNKQNTNQSSE